MLQSDLRSSPGRRTNRENFRTLSKNEVVFTPSYFYSQ